MDTVPVASDIFRFLDIRAPQVERTDRTSYTIKRNLFAFPETPLEERFRAIPHDDTYAARLDSLIPTGKSVRDLLSPLKGGFLEKITEFKSILLDGELPPDSKLSRFTSALPAANPTQDQKYYVEITATAWDNFLWATLLTLVGSPVDDNTLINLSSVLRVASAIFAVRNAQAGTNSDVDLSLFTIASIQIPLDLLDPQKMRATRPAKERVLGDRTSRDYQNTLCMRLTVLEVAAADLRKCLLNREFSLPAPPVAAPPEAAGGVETEYTISSEPFRISVPDGQLSEATRILLSQRFGATRQAGSVDNIDILGTLGQIETEIDQVGRELFGSTNPARILAASQQISLLQWRLRNDEAIDQASFSRLGLMISAPLLGDPAETGRTPPSGVQLLGVGDLKVVKQTLMRYDAGEVAHIENVLVGQYKERTHSVKQTTEETLVVEQEKSVSLEKDLQSTDRFEVANEAQSVVKEQRQNEAGVTVSASYGPVSISANTRFSDISSQEQSSKVSRQFAREVLNKSVEKVEQRVREQRTRKTTQEVEEVNKYTQTAATKSVVGIYRWVDKIYSARVNVYGKRMMLEFMLPEPAAVYLHSKTTRPPDPSAVKQPDPLTIRASDITRSNYASFAASYGAEVDRPPPSVQLTKFASRSNTDNEKTKITLDEGWIGVTAAASASWLAPPNGTLKAQIGHAQWDGRNKTWYTQSLSADATGDIPLSVTPNQVSAFNVVGSVSAVPSDALLDKWKLDTYKAIAAAYQLRLNEFRDYLASQRRTDPNVSENQDSVNRATERSELQRACVEVLTRQHFDGPGAISDNPATGWPELDFQETDKRGKLVAFFEQSFEWEQMTYVFYPYFWGRQSEWSARLSIANSDQLFTKFLTSGYARVVVPVRPAHESDLAFFLATGVIWGGAEPPVMGDPRFVSVVDEIKESLSAPDGEVEEGEPWQVKVPTSLVILDDSGQLPSWPLNVSGTGLFSPSEATCRGIPYNLAQWKDARTIADAIRKLGYAVDSSSDPAMALKSARPAIRAMQTRFNQLGAHAITGAPLLVDGIAGPCTLRALTYFDALRAGGKWTGV